jgi:hypothetical protein
MGTKTYSKKKDTKKNTKKNIKKSKYHICTLVETFLSMLDTIKLYHWNTRNYGEHLATDKIFQQLSENVDTFVETFLGKYPQRISGPLINIKIKSISIGSDTVFLQQMKTYQQYLQEMDKFSTDLLNIRDEMLGNLNQLMYLFSLK